MDSQTDNKTAKTRTRKYQATIADAIKQLDTSIYLA